MAAILRKLRKQGTEMLLANAFTLTRLSPHRCSVVSQRVLKVKKHPSMLRIAGGLCIWNIAGTLGIESVRETILKCTYFSEERGCQYAGDAGRGLLTRMWSGEKNGEF